MSRFATPLALLRRKACTLSDVVGRLAHAHRIYRASWGSLLSRFTNLYFFERHSPTEIFLWGLIDPAIGDQDLHDYISKEKLLRQQRRLNPLYASVFTEDKSVFYLYCAALGIPVPRLFAIVEPDFAWTAKGQLLADRHAWKEFIENHTSADLIVKPSRGVYAQDVWALQRSGSILIDHEGRTFDADELLARMRRNRRYRSFIVQQRIRNHPVLEELSGTRALQTLRIVTAVESNGEVAVLLAELRIICGASASDNFSSGTSRNMLGNIDLRSGKIECVVAASRTHLGTEVLSHHPKAGRMFNKLRIPHWAAAVAMIKNISARFLPLRTIGWDLAIAPDGPVVIEGNAWWDPGCINAFRRMGIFRSYLQRNSIAKPD